MARRSSTPVMPSVDREPTEKAHGFRKSPLEFEQRDLGSARSIGAKRAGRIWSPTRDLHERRLTIRSV